ncbi:MAG: ketopantoate reductase family protein [Firmicutes bacterium]|nr:ketopantoate reductase family protein [Bacillota bacterium]
MHNINKVALVGLGAIGCAYASRIMDTDPKLLHVVASEKRAQRWAQGIQVNGHPYFFPLVSPLGPPEPMDIVFVAVKYHQLPQAIEDMRRFVGPQTIILSLLNGISSEEIIAQEYGWEHLLYGLCVGIDAVRENGVVEFSHTGKVMFGEKTNEVPSARVERVQRFFARCNISYEVPTDMIRALWWKFMINVGINQMSGVLRAPYGAFQQIPEATDLMKAAMREVILLSQRARIGLKEDDIEAFIHFLHTLSPEGKTSMLQDVEAGRKTEVEMFAGDVCRLGQEYQLPTPVNEMLLQMIHAMEKM